MSSQALITNPLIPSTQLLGNLATGQLLQVKGDKGSAVILCRPHYAQMIGPGSAIGGMFDLDVRQIIPLGEISFQAPETGEDRQKAFLTRQKWCAFIEKVIADHDSPLERAFLILEKLESYCGLQVVNFLSDEILAQLVGVLPKTIAIARSHKHHQKAQKLESLVEEKKIKQSVS